MRIALLAPILAASTFAACRGEPAEAPRSGAESEFHAFIQDAMATGPAPGMAVAVVRGDEVVYVEGFGMADLEQGRAVEPGTVFYIASSTKSFTGLAAAILAGRGRLDLDAPLGTYLPTVRLTPPLSADSITLRQLLTHTHGMDNGGPIVLRTAYTGVHDQDLLLGFLERQPAGSQGRGFRYGNLGYNVASLALDVELGESWKDVLASEIFEPLKMRSTTAYMSKADRGRLAMPYRWGPDGWEARPYAKDDENMHAAGGVLSTAEDLGRWLVANLNDGRVDGRQALPASAIAEAHTSFAENDDAWGPFTREGYGLGWHTGHYDGVRQLHHFGGFPGFHTHVSFLPDEDLGVVVLVNESSLGADLATAVAAFAYDAFLERDDLADRRAKLLGGLEESIASGQAATIADRDRRAARPQELPRPLSAYAGVYEHPELGRMTWTVRGDRLHAAIGLAESYAETYSADDDALRVELTGSGSVVGFDFPDGADRATAMTIAGYRLERAD